MTIVLALSTPLTVAVVLWFLNRREEREARDRQILLNRIQSPETAVVQTLQPEEVELGPPDTEWQEAAAHARLMENYTDG